MKERIQKVLARAGYGSRREIETWLRAGRITVNHRLAQLGDQVSPEDKIAIDGKRCILSATHPTRVLLYHKPIGLVCTRHDPEGRKTIFEQLPTIAHGRWINVGRLDINTSGLLILTNDGALAHRLMHPSSQLIREYAVRVVGKVSAGILKRLQDGVALEDGLARFDSIVDAGGSGINHWFHVTVPEGRNRLVRRLWESQGVTVSRLVRVRFGPITLPKSLARGKYCEIDIKRYPELNF